MLYWSIHGGYLVKLAMYRGRGYIIGAYTKWILMYDCTSEDVGGKGNKNLGNVGLAGAYTSRGDRLGWTWSIHGGYPCIGGVAMGRGQIIRDRL
jgi:hypothetical protein